MVIDRESGRGENGKVKSEAIRKGREGR